MSRSYCLSDITICITSFLRFSCLKKCIESVRWFYPEMKILVVDNSGEYSTNDEDFAWCVSCPNVEIIKADFDVGLSVCRNVAVNNVKTPLCFIIDDDTIFTPFSCLEKLLSVYNHDLNVDVCSGVSLKNSSVYTWGGIIKNIDTGKLYFEQIDLTKFKIVENTTIYYRSSSYLNFLLASVETLKECPWDNRRKTLTEHLDHVLELHLKNKNVVVVPTCVFINTRETNELYQNYRGRFFPGYIDNLYSERGITVEHAPKSIYLNCHFDNYSVEFSKPNIVLLAYPVSDFLYIIEFLKSSGWNTSVLDNGLYAKYFNDINYDLLVRGTYPSVMMKEFLAKLDKPWVLCGDNFVLALERWIDALSPYKPTLYVLNNKNGVNVSALADKFSKIIDYWAWNKISIVR